MSLILRYEQPVGCPHPEWLSAPAAGAELIQTERVTEPILPWSADRPGADVLPVATRVRVRFLRPELLVCVACGVSLRVALCVHPRWQDTCKADAAAVDRLVCIVCSSTLRDARSALRMIFDPEEL